MKNIMKVVDVIALIILLIGGLNYLIAGVFGFDVMAWIFGTEISLVGRIIYGLIGLSAAILVITIIARVVQRNKKLSN